MEPWGKVKKDMGDRNGGFLGLSPHTGEPCQENGAEFLLHLLYPYRKMQEKQKELECESRTQHEKHLCWGVLE